MAKVDVLDWNKKKVGSVELNPEVFEQPVKKAVMHSVVKWQLAKRRRGTHSTKTRSTINGTGKKPFKQKGTGNARQGSARSPLNEGGAVLFGPQPRDYGYTLPRKMKQAGLKSALSYLHAAGRIIVLDGMDSAEGKTKDLNTNLKSLGLTKAVLLGNEENTNMKRAARNLKSFRYYGIEGLNVYDLLKFDNVVISKDSLAGVEQRCGLGVKS